MESSDDFGGPNDYIIYIYSYFFSVSVFKEHFEQFQLCSTRKKSKQAITIDNGWLWMYQNSTQTS